MTAYTYRGAGYDTVTPSAADRARSQQQRLARVTAHVAELTAAGATAQAIADVAGVSHDAVVDIRRGVRRYVMPATAGMLLGVTRAQALARTRELEAPWRRSGAESNARRSAAGSARQVAAARRLLEAVEADPALAARLSAAQWRVLEARLARPEVSLPELAAGLGWTKAQAWSHLRRALEVLERVEGAA